jgi:DNA-binding transcriptional MerR regulator
MKLRFIRAARAAGLLNHDIKPLLYAINKGDLQAYDEAMSALQRKSKNDKHTCTQWIHNYPNYAN